jgi:hypothetical protein
MFHTSFFVNKVINDKRQMMVLELTGSKFIEILKTVNHCYREYFCNDVVHMILKLIDNLHSVRKLIST